MDDNSSKASSSLVVAEKNVRKPGGCVGIFCKLFDWNRRFAKKKLFSKKLLAPARGNKVSKKLNSYENLIDDANGGSKHEMSSPGLVARLMGLDSLPVVKRKSSDENSMNVGFVKKSDKKIKNYEKGRLGNGFHSQKIQKTGLFERRPVNRFGADAMHIRNVLSKSKKRHPKLSSPVKSQRSAKNTSRLIGAATRILEPSRAKCALTYSNSISQQPTKDEIMRRAKSMISLPVKSSSQVAIGQDLMAQSSCRNCGHELHGTNKALSRCDRETEVVLLRNRYQPEHLMNQGKVISRSHQHETIFHGTPFASNGKINLGLKGNSSIHQQTCLNKSVSSTTAFNEKKDFIAMNRNVSQTQFRCQRKPSYQVPQAECSSSSSSVMDRERNSECKHMLGRRPRFGCKLEYPTFPKPMDHMKVDQSNFINSGVSGQRLINGNIGVKSMSPLFMNEDTLGTVLAHKLKELASQGENESQGKTANAILQDLIYALTAERRISSELSDSICSDAGMTYRPSQADARGKRLPARFSGNHSSPGSVLDASFSNDSCVSSSIDDSSGNILQSDLQSLHSDRDFYDHQTSFNRKETVCNVPVSHLLDQISGALDRTNLPGLKLSSAYSAYTKEVLFNCELLFGNADGSETFIDFLVGPFLDELQTLAIAAWKNTVISGFQVSKSRRFLFDCLVECLSIKYDRYSYSGFMEWCRVPKLLNADALIRLFDYEVRKSASLARMNLDEIIDWEMNASLTKWADFELDMFESGAEISLFIFQGLVDEIVADFMYKLNL